MKLACLLPQVIVGCSYLPYFWLLIYYQIDTSTQSQINHSPPWSSPSRGPVMGGWESRGTTVRELHPFWSVSTDRNSPCERSLCNATSTQKRPEKNHSSLIIINPCLSDLLRSSTSTISHPPYLPLRRAKLFAKPSHLSGYVDPSVGPAIAIPQKDREKAKSISTITEKYYL